MKIFSLLLLSLLSLNAQAATVHSCGPLDSIDNLKGFVHSFVGDRVRVAHISTKEPVAAPEHLLIFVSDESMGVSCYAVSATTDGLGFGRIAFHKLEWSDDLETGLVLSVPVSKYDRDTGSLKPNGIVKVRVSRKNGDNKVTIE